MEFVKERRIYRSTLLQRGFLGYHPELRISKGEWFHEENLSSRQFPLLCPRLPRRKVKDVPVQGLGKLKGLCYVSDSTLYYGDHSLPLNLTPGEKTILPFGAYLILLPDMVWVNTVDHSHGFLEKGEQFQGDLGILWCDRQGQPLEALVDGKEPPENPLQLWLDTGEAPAQLKAYSQETGLWYPIEGTCIRVVGDGIGRSFQKGDRLLIEKNPELEAMVGPGLHEILACDRDYIALEGRMDVLRKELKEQQAELRALIPKMDFLLRHENRLWGCRYGPDHNGTFVNEIYASALGDFKSWYSFQSIASDSYTASLGAPGPFTGAAVVAGHPVFFKENSLHRIYGTRPANFGIQSLNCVGVAPGSEKSTALLDNSLIYLGRDGFYLYDGSLPVKLSQDLKTKTYRNAIAGVLGRSYYASVLEDGAPVLLCYDRDHRLWHRESAIDLHSMVTVGDVLYYTTGEPGLFAIGTTEGQPVEKQVLWEAVTSILREEEPKEGYAVGLRLRLSMEPGSALTVYGEYDSSGTWEPLGSLSGYRLRSGDVPLRLRRCDHLRLRLQGRGNVTVHTMTLMMEG